MMKKLMVVCTLIMGVSGIYVHGAEAAGSAVEDKEIIVEKKISSDTNVVFLNADRRYSRESIFDVMSSSEEDDASYVLNSSERVVVPYVGAVDMAGIQHGSFYYIFVPNRNKNDLLVFRVRENGTIQPDEFGNKFTRIETGAPVVSVTPVKDKDNILLIGVTTQTPSLEVFSLVGEKWNSRANVPLSSPVAASASAAASAAADADAVHSDIVINSILHKGLIHFFMVDANNPQVQVATMHSSGITMQNYPELSLPFIVGDMHEGKKYNIATIDHNKELYVFVVGARDKSNGFIYGWKLEDNGRFVPVIQKQVDRLPHNVLVNDTSDGLYITVTFFNDFSIEVYKLTRTSFDGPMGQARVHDVPIQARNIPYKDNKNIMVLVKSLFRRDTYVLRIYQIGDEGVIPTAERELPVSRISMPYVDFLLIPGLTKQQVVEILDESIGRKYQYPLDVLGAIAEFVVENY